MADSKVKILDSAVPETKADYQSLNGEEWRMSIEHEIHRALLAQHGLFSIARAWPRSTANVSIVLTCVGQNDEVVEVTVVSEPPDLVRQQIGKPVERRDAKPAEPQFEAGPQEGSNAPIKVTRRHST